MKNDTSRYPRTIVSFAIVMLGTGVERYELLGLLWPICGPFSCSMKIISTIGYVVVGLSIAADDVECKRRATRFPRDLCFYPQPHVSRPRNWLPYVRLGSMLHQAQF